MDFQLVLLEKFEFSGAQHVARRNLHKSVRKISLLILLLDLPLNNSQFFQFFQFLVGYLISLDYRRRHLSKNCWGVFIL